ncbi:IclR family transcriptional regulator [Actinomadura sp. HBU206391]|uniref:IclR family transcriptional regulator n=1 Tax=Actinomadura sp. HBU206391 TaxID=2731692 RepID=UPI00164F7DE9|nr:IclR family transcriptional regulator [Actinomadura sp. HBU206391]MBC6461906.1 IclR family transcriptional regulator [Actinomadura sp. HBU206391]
MRSSDRLLELLEELGSAHGQTLTALSQRLDLPKPTVLRLLRSLEERGWVWHLPDGGYGLGQRFLVVAQQAIGRDSVLRWAPQHMIALRDSIGETVSLLSVAGTSRVCMLEFPSRQPLRYVHEVGSQGPLHAGASGKILLAFGPDELRQAVLGRPLERYTEQTFTDVAQMEAELQRVRTAGWAMSQGERSEGSVAVGVPLHDPQSGRVHSLTVFAPQVRFRATSRPAWVEQISACARAIETAAGSSSEVDHIA